MAYQVLQGDCLEQLKTLPSESIHCCVTSPPYWGLRDYGVDGQIGLEKTPDEYVEKLVNVFREVKRVLKNDGTVWLNLGDSYAGGGQGGHADGNVSKLVQYPHVKKPFEIGLKPKDLVGIPWRVAFALQADGWYLRSDIIWHKPNPMPESVTDRPTKSHEYIFLLAKSQKYYFDNEAVREKSEWFEKDKRAINGPSNGIKVQDGIYAMQHCGAFSPDGNRNIRSVWTVSTHPYKEAHFATFPEKLIIPCIKAGCPKGGVVLDPFSGSGTTGVVAEKLGREYIGIELNPQYIKMSEDRIYNVQPLFAGLEL